MRKLTRRSYNRKLIVFGLVMLLAIGMISTGFAAWVMSAVSNANAEANVTVGTLSDASMSITVDQWRKEGEDITEKWYGETISFDAKNGDDTGRIRDDGNAETDENLTMTISGKVTNVAALNELTMTIELPESIVAAIDAKYIAITGATAENYAAGKLTLTKADLGYTLVDDNANATFTYTLTFEWGEFFGGVNPCEFYDSATASRTSTDPAVVGNTISDADMQSEMATFRKAITGLEDSGADYSGTINITVAATTN